MQELLERVKEYRDSETSPLVISRLNSICVDILGMLEKEKEVMCEFAKLYDDDLSNGIIRTREDLFNETFNTKEMEKPLDKVFICDRIQHFSNKLVKACNEGDEVLTGHYTAKIRGFLEQLDR